MPWEWDLGMGGHCTTVIGNDIILKSYCGSVVQRTGGPPPPVNAQRYGPPCLGRVKTMDQSALAVGPRPGDLKQEVKVQRSAVARRQDARLCTKPPPPIDQSLKSNYLEV